MKPSETNVSITVLLMILCKNSSTSLQCLFLCDQTVFEANISSYHINSFFTEDMTIAYMNKLLFVLGYETFNGENTHGSFNLQHQKFLAQLAGNLGLFLGFSFFSVILTTIECFKNMVKRLKNALPYH